MDVGDKKQFWRLSGCGVGCALGDVRGTGSTSHMNRGGYPGIGSYRSRSSPRRSVYRLGQPWIGSSSSRARAPTHADQYPEAGLAVERAMAQRTGIARALRPRVLWISSRYVTCSGLTCYDQRDDALAFERHNAKEVGQ